MHTRPQTLNGPFGLVLAFASMQVIAATCTPLSAQNANTDINNLINQEQPRVEGSRKSTPQNADSGVVPNHEVWVREDSPRHNLHLISGRALAGSNCVKVIFERAPMIEHRHDTSASKTVELDINNLCLLGLRNASEKKEMIVRAGEELRAVAIATTSRLFSGKRFAPMQQIFIPIRPLNVGRLSIKFEVLWADELSAKKPRIDVIQVELQTSKGSG